MSQETKPGHEPLVVSPQGTQQAGTGGSLQSAGGTQTFSLGQFFKGDLGLLPVFVALVLEVIFFQITTKGLFLDLGNIYNLEGQIIEASIVSLAAVLVLLIGEIDLSLAAVAYLSGAATGVLVQRAHWPAVQGMLGGIAIGVAVGLVNGFFIAVMRMPSFIVTLAGLIGYQGLISKVLEPQTTLPVYDHTIDAIAYTNLPDYLAIALPVIGLAGFAGAVILNYLRRRSRNLSVKPIGQIALQLAVIVLLVIGVVVVFASSPGGGTPLTFVILIGLILVFWILLTRTAFGRHVYAVGGNVEAARRAGVRVVGLKIALFTLASSLAALSGIFADSRQFSAAAQVSPTLLLNAIAAAVIGGVSLFGGRGTVWAVLPGTLVVYGLLNGLALLQQPASVQLMAEGIILLVAVLVDAILRRRSQTGYR